MTGALGKGGELLSVAFEPFLSCCGPSAFDCVLGRTGWNVIP